MIYYLWLLHLWNDWLVGALIELLAGIPSSACPWIPVLQTSPMTQFQRLTRISTQVFNSSISKRMIEEAKHQDKKESQNYWVRRWGVGWERERESRGTAKDPDCNALSNFLKSATASGLNNTTKLGKRNESDMGNKNKRNTVDNKRKCRESVITDVNHVNTAFVSWSFVAMAYICISCGISCVLVTLTQSPRWTQVAGYLTPRFILLENRSRMVPLLPPFPSSRANHRSKFIVVLN